MTEQRSISILYNVKDAPALISSGYAKIGQYTTPFLMDAGWDVRLHCRVGHETNILTWKEPWSGKEMEIWSGGGGPYGEDMIPSHLAKLAEVSGKPGVVLFCGDTVALGLLAELAKRHEVAACAWTAVDWEYPTPKYALDKITSFLRTWSMSDHGTRVLSLDGAKNLLPTVWCGVNTELWDPKRFDAKELEKTKAEMGYGNDTFNVFSCFANQFQRKNESQMLDGIGEFAKRHPEAKVRFFGLTQTRRDWDMHALTDHLKLNEICKWSDDYRGHMGGYTEEDVARMMMSSDCVMSLGYEGFGLQTIEAQSLARPVIGFNAGATPELLRAGVLVPPLMTMRFAPMFERPLPDPEYILKALEAVYAERNVPHRWDNGRKWVQENLTWEHCGKALVDRMESVEQAIADEELMGPPAPGPRAVEMAKQQLVIE